MNPIRVGDKVRFLNDVGGGVVKTINGRVAIVENADGFDIPTPINLLVKDLQFWSDDADHYSNSKSEPKPSVKQPIKQEVVVEQLDEYEKIVNINEFDNAHIYFGLVKKQTSYAIWLINDSPYRLLFSFSGFHENDTTAYGIKAGIIEDDTKIVLTTCTETELKEYRFMHIDLIFYSQWKYKLRKPIAYTFETNRPLITDSLSYIPNDFFDNNAYIEEIKSSSDFKSDFKQIIMKSEIVAKNVDIKSTKPSKQTDEIEEVDLHIESILDNHEGMMPKEILDAQMSRFRFALENAAHRGVKRMVFIHGVGNGKLRYSMRKALDTEYSKYKYQDASFREYGYGATMVILK